MLKVIIATLIISSSAFDEGEMIPSQYTCEGENINPPLEIKKIPEGTESLALIADDPDAPAGTWVHWVMWNIPVDSKIKKNSIPGTEGINSFKKHHYGGPCPPSGTHRYYFKIYALDTKLDLKKSSGKEDLLEAMEGHIIGKGSLMGKYSKKD